MLKGYPSKCIISASSDWSIKVWDTEKRNAFTSIGHKINVYAINITNDGENVISGSNDGELIFWNFKTGEKRFSSNLHKQMISAITINNNNVLSASFDGTVRIWDSNTLKVLKTFWLDIGRISAQVLTKDNKHLILGTTSGKIVKLLYMEGTIKWIKEMSVGDINSIDVSHDSKFIAVSSIYGAVTILSLNDGKELQTFFAPLPKHVLVMTVYHVTFSSDNHYVYGACNDSVIYCWDWTKRQIVNQFRSHEGKITSINFERSNKYMFSTAEDATLKVWDIRSKKVIAGFTCDGPICVGRITPDGNKIVIGEQSGTIHFLEFINLPNND